MALSASQKLCLGVVGLNMCVASLVAATYFDAMDDTILHKINWAGPHPDEMLVCVNKDGNVSCKMKH